MGGGVKPLAIDLFAGLGGWTDGLLSAGWRVIGFDIERHEYGEQRYPAQLVLQDVLTIDGAQFRDADLIVASPPCQEFSYMAMPWSRAKQIARALRGEDEFPDGYRGSRTVAELTALFDACFRIQREASAAAGRHIPMVIENVKGAQPWVGRARWNYGSFYLWGDVPALMPITAGRAVMKEGVAHRSNGETNFHASAARARDGVKAPGMNWSDQTKRGQDFTRLAGNHAMDGVKGFTPNGEPLGKNRGPRRHGSKSQARKAASAMIAKIPPDLAGHIAKVFRPVARP